MCAVLYTSWHKSIMTEPQAREVKVGHWLYDGVKPMAVKIFAINYDYYYYEIAKADNILEENEQPELNENGYIYMIRWGDSEWFDFGSITVEGGRLDIETAMKKAEGKVKGGIKWK